jgi:4-carboxymuconolactone decarboxylase
MTDAAADDALGGRLKLLLPSELSPDQKRTYDVIDAEMVPWAESAGFRSKTDDGRLIGPFNSVLYSPGISPAFLALQAAEQKNTTLDERVRQVMILTVGAVWGCDYERYAHAAVARRAGIPDAAIAALARGDPADGLSAKERLAQRFTYEITAHRRIDDALYDEAQATFGPQGLVDMLYLVGCYQTISSLLNTFKVPAPV